MRDNLRFHGKMASRQFKLSKIFFPEKNMPNTFKRIGQQPPTLSGNITKRDLSKSDNHHRKSIRLGYQSLLKQEQARFLERPETQKRNPSNRITS